MSGTFTEFTTAPDGLLELSEDSLKSLLRTEPIRDIYHVEETPFARGKFASVKKVRHLETGREYAAKVIRKRRRDAMREIQHEVAVLALCSGTPRVVRLHEVYDSRTEVAIILELASGGELQRVLDEEERLMEGAARRAMRHVLEGLAHLHARRIAHLDLKPQNLLLDQAGDVCICDFGISRAIQPGAQVREILGTRDYVAPEILSYEPISLAADVWSVGVLAYVLLSGYSPFAGATKQETYLNIAQCSLTFPQELFSGVSDTALQFVRDTLVLDPKGRLTVEQCLEHPWLQDDNTHVPHSLADKSVTAANGHETNGLNGYESNGLNGHEINGINGHEANGLNGHETNGINGHETNGLNGYESNGLKGHETNGINGHGGNGLNGHDTNGHGDTPETKGANGHEANGTNGDHNDEHKPLRHLHETAPPFPDAPSTPKVSRKSHLASPISVRQLCKKFQPEPEASDKRKPLDALDGNKPCACGCDCVECSPHARRPRPPLPPDRAIIC